MTEENLKRGRQNCCRLCLAPDSECISILNSYAADKEPLVTKIHNCVHIKVTPSDGLSLRICHACISYLNSWQSFKNRCIASQGKQRNWLEFSKRQQLLENNVSISTISSSATAAKQLQKQQQQEQDQFPQESNLASSILDGITSLKKRKSLTVYPLPAVQVKDEPLDEDDYDAMKQQQDESDEMVDPTLFLERTEEEGTEPYMDTSVYSYEQPPRHNIRTVPDRTTIEVAGAAEVKEASCRACNLKFSTRANARRHERNLHPNLFELSTSTSSSTPVTRPTAALAAALELQRAAAAAEHAKKNAAAAALNPMAPKMRQHIVNAANATTAPTYDYDNPEQYQDLLTDEKIVFIQQNESFLQQYQTMTCKCCNKFYTSYKNFMAHMRKKYVTLPRNLCFNCLKLNDTKSLFISHLKKRNCINLYKVMHALMAKVPSFASAVAATAAAMPEKMRAKELLVNKIYECKLCTQHFRLKLEFRSHVYDEHADAQKKDVLPGQCGFCGMEIEDPLERKRHYNNMDCIVILRCVTCDEKFGNHQKFLDHVYAKHLVQTGTPGAEHQRQQQPTNILQQQLTSSENSPGKKSNMGGFTGASSADESRSSSMPQTAGKSQYFSRMPQACPICGQQYNNYNNVLRHMESKHPDQLPQTYKCVKCGKGYPRLSNLREHMLTVHSATANIEKARSTSFEYIVNADAVKSMDSGGGAGGSGGAYSGRYDYVMKDLMSITNGGTCAEDDDDDDGENTPTVKKMRLDSSANTSVNSNNTLSNYKECPICSAIFSNKIGLSNHMRSHAASMQSYNAASPAFRDASKAAADLKSIAATGTNSSSGGAGGFPLQPKALAQQAAVSRRSLELAADRRFRRMRCRMCQKRFSSKKSYRRHMLDDHQIRNVQFIKCKLCDAEFAYEKGLKVHMFKIHNTLLKDEMIIKQYECDICSIVYRTEDQLLQHKKTVHGNENAHPDDFVDDATGATVGGTVVADAGSNANSTPSADVSGGNATPLDPNSGAPVPLYWYQCKYCPSNFNTNKKLAIHINSHDEFDSSDYSCKDCGNVYSGRKSLWVHRYKKHPQIAEPSECVLCRKVFFDAHMLENHIPTCNRKPITATGAMAEHATPLNTFYRHKTGDDEDDEGSRVADGNVDADERAGSGGAIGTLGGGEVEIHAMPQVGGANSAKKIKLPEVACTICGQRFTDQELFTKHIQVHERELYTDNPLAAMFDTGPADPNQFYLDRVNDNGEYACDICTKTFTQMTALKVHRKWHFRGDSKQNLADGDPSAYATSQTHNLLHPPGLQAVGLMPNPRPSKSQKRKRELKCEYCPSTFISNNNLRRHIYELHKSEIAHWPEPPKIDLDEYLHCRKCVLKFETKKDWIDHKVADARIMKPYGPFQWGCELCGEYVSRKEKLIHHIQSHMKEQQIVPVHQRQQQQQPAVTTNNKISAVGESYAGESNSQDSQQSEENGGGDSDGDGATKEDAEEYEEDDAAVEYVGDEEQEEEEDEDDEEVGDEAGEVDEDDEVTAAKNDECIEIDGQVAEEEEEGDMDNEENIENIDENANDGQNGNDEDEMEDDDEDDDEGVDEDDVDDGDEDDDDVTNESAKTKQMQRQKRNKNSSDGTEVEDSMTFVNEDDDDDDDEDDDDDDDDDDEEEVEEDGVVEQDHDYANIHPDMEDVEENEVEVVTENAHASKKRGQAESKTHFSCDLCQVFFDTQLELQKHVKIHFLNGPGSVTLTEIRAKQVNKSRSSGSSDIVTVSSS